MARLQITDAAQADLPGIQDYIAEHNRSRAIVDRVLRRIDQSCEILATRPLMGRSRDDLAPGLRYHPCEHYLIVYRPTGHGIEVARVLHSKRNIDDIFH